MTDLFSQCMYVRTYVCVCHTQECQFALTCMQRNSTSCVGEYQMPSLGLAKEDREEQHFLTMEVEQHGWSFTTYAFCGVEY